MVNHKLIITAMTLPGLIGTAYAKEKTELERLRNTINLIKQSNVNLIKQFVKQGVLPEKVADAMIKQTEADAVKQVAQAIADMTDKPEDNLPVGTASVSADLPPLVEKSARASADRIPPNEYRVAYVPEIVKDDIQQKVRKSVRDEVVGDVLEKAKNERWGIADALPEWTRRFRLYGDIRLRDQSSMLGSGNISMQDNFNGGGIYTNYQAVNNPNEFSFSPQSLTQPGTYNALYNTTHNQNIARERFRLGIEAQIADNLDAGIRLTTGNTQNPISTNQSLGNTGQGYQFAIDRAFVRYNLYDNKSFNWLTLMGGRTPNPFFTGSSELVWDEDLSFEGLALTLRKRLSGDNFLDDIGGKGPVFFASTGIFPIQATTPWVTQSSLEKWMFGGQTGLEWGFDNQDILEVAGAYYDFQGIKAQVNASAYDNSCIDSPANVTLSAPQFIQGGNTMVGLCQNGAAGSYNAGAVGLYGLASNFNILNLNALYDMALFSPVHIRISGDFAKNLGFNQNKVNQVLNINPYFATPLKSSGSYGWQFKVDLGWPRVDLPGNWNVFTIYRYVESDAVLSSYTDSDFHFGFTNVKGWILAGNYGLMKNVWVTGKYMSADMISGPAYGMDILQLDINTRF